MTTDPHFLVERSAVLELTPKSASQFSLHIWAEIATYLDGVARFLRVFLVDACQTPASESVYLSEPKGRDGAF